MLGQDVKMNLFGDKHYIIKRLKVSSAGTDA